VRRRATRDTSECGKKTQSLSEITAILFTGEVSPSREIENGKIENEVILEVKIAQIEEFFKKFSRF
jgi:hypothetical protein